MDEMTFHQLHDFDIFFKDFWNEIYNADRLDKSKIVDFICKNSPRGSIYKISFKLYGMFQDFKSKKKPLYLDGKPLSEDTISTLCDWLNIIVRAQSKLSSQPAQKGPCVSTYMNITTNYKPLIK